MFRTTSFIASLFLMLFSVSTTFGQTLSAEQLKENLLSSNRDTAPFIISDGTDEGVDLIAEWKIVDAEWQTIFGKGELEKVFKIRMKFDESKKHLRAKDEEYTVEWKSGLAKVSKSKSKFKGQKTESSFGKAVVYTEKLEGNVIYEYKFNTKEIKDHIKNIIEDAGWKYKPVAFKEL